MAAGFYNFNSASVTGPGEAPVTVEEYLARTLRGTMTRASFTMPLRMALIVFSLDSNSEPFVSVQWCYCEGSLALNVASKFVRV